MNLEKRQFLTAVGGTIAASAAGLAGCLESVTSNGSSDDEDDTGTGDGEDDTGNERNGGDEGDEGDEDDSESVVDERTGPLAYREWLPPGDGTVAFAYLDWEKVMELPDESDDEDDENEIDDGGDPMLGLPWNGTGRIVPGAVGADLVEADLLELIDPDADENNGFESTVTGLLAVNDCSVLIGDIAPDEIGDRLTTDPEDWYPVQFERVDGVDDYDVYHGVDRENRVAAVGDDAVVYRRGDGADEAVRSLLESRLAARLEDRIADPETDTDTEASWLVETGGRGHLAFGGYGGPPAMAVEKIGVESQSYDVAAQYDALSDVEGVVAAAEIREDEVEMIGSFAAVFEDGSDVGSDLEERLGSTATDRTVEVDGQRISAIARWTGDEEDSPVPRL